MSARLMHDPGCKRNVCTCGYNKKQKKNTKSATSDD